MPVPGRFLGALASHWITLGAIAGIGGGVLLSYRLTFPYTWTLAIPLALFALNLLAAVAVRPAFRRQPALLIFHLALLAIILLVAASRLTYLSGWAEVMTGETFAGELAVDQRAPWHFGGIERVRFVNEGFSIDYAAGGRRRETFNRVSYVDDRGQHTTITIGDEHPLELSGYRFYTSSNKGFSAAFEWTPTGASLPTLLLVSFPSYPAQALRQSYELKLPGHETPVWAQLQLPDNFLAATGPTRFHPPAEHQLIIRYADERKALRPGDEVLLEKNRLRYIRLDTWMGYWVHYDWTRPWLIAAILAAVVSLSWFIVGRFTRSSWMR